MLTLSGDARTVSLITESMNRGASYGITLMTAFFRAAACIVSVAMLLSFPASGVHHFGTHVRTPEVRRAIVRHSSVALDDENAHERVAQCDLLPVFFTPSETIGKITPRSDFESPPVVLSRLLSRLKLNPSGSSGQDPLLQA